MWLIEIAEWTVGDVVDWLTAVNLSQYADAFIQNDISGPILLDMSLEDLDYMKINALGHRKIILKSVELFRREGRMSMSSAIKAENSTVKPRPQEVDSWLYMFYQCVRCDCVTCV